MLQDLDHTLPQLRREALKDQVRIALAHGPARRVRDVVTQHNIMQTEQRGRTVREMRDGETGGRAAVLVQQDQVRRGRGMARRAQQRQNGVAAVEPDAVGQEQPDLFGELQQAG